MEVFQAVEDCLSIERERGLARFKAAKISEEHIIKRPICSAKELDFYPVGTGNEEMVSDKAE